MIGRTVMSRLLHLHWETPHREVGYFIGISLISFALVSAITWVLGFAGVLFAVLGMLGLAIGWVAVAVLALKAAWERREAPRVALLAAAAPILGFALAAALALPVIWGTLWALDWGWFLWKQPAYDEIVRLAEAGRIGHSDAFWREHDGTTFVFDDGTPARLAFPLPGGFLDNWSGVVYDPTGDVMQADGWDTQTGVFKAPDAGTKLFGGDLEKCRHLMGDYYRCGFT